MSGFRSDLDQLRQYAGRFDDLAGQAGKTARDARAAVESAGPCWGGDEIGAAFAGTHLPGTEQALDELDGLVSGLREMGVKLVETASDQQRTDSDNAGELGRIVGQG
ncbi:WXG100 family type VII secretion target [Parasphingorhabdus pacifica]